MSLSLTFLGAARTVTGSKFLLEGGGRRVLVDAGLFQGRKELREQNWRRLPVTAATLDAIVLTHAHIDHTGYLPRLLHQGFRGRVFCSPATRALLEIVLPDAGHLQEEEARYANRKGYTRHRPALPLYTREDGEKAARMAEPRSYGAWFEPAAGFSVRLRPAGHILGSAYAEVRCEGVRVVFSGDLGGYGEDVMEPPAPIPPDVDYLLVESTYGGRDSEHRPLDVQFAETVGPALERGGVVVIPAFAIGRSTLVLHYLGRLMKEGRIPEAPVHVDSPMAVDAVELYCRYARDPNVRHQRLVDSESCPLRPRRVELVRLVEESKALNEKKGPRVIVSASGMATGGRVLHHLKHRLPDPKNLVLLVGYQAFGTRGRRLLEGEEQVKIHGRYVPVRAQVASIRGLSAHGDEGDLLRWMRTAGRRPRRTFLVHGEEEGLRAMAKRAEEMRWPAEIPELGERVVLEER